MGGPIRTMRIKDFDDNSCSEGSWLDVTDSDEQEDDTTDTTKLPRNQEYGVPEKLEGMIIENKEAAVQQEGGWDEDEEYHVDSGKEDRNDTKDLREDTARDENAHNQNEEDALTDKEGEEEQVPEKTEGVGIENKQAGVRQEGGSKEDEEPHSFSERKDSTVAHSLQEDRVRNDDAPIQNEVQEDAQSAEEAEETKSETPRKEREKRAMALNDAYEALEKIRRANLELMAVECCGGAKITPVIDYSMCTQCLLASIQERAAVAEAAPTSPEESTTTPAPRFSRIRRIVQQRSTSTSSGSGSAVRFPRINRFVKSMSSQQQEGASDASLAADLPGGETAASPINDLALNVAGSGSKTDSVAGDATGTGCKHSDFSLLQKESSAGDDTLLDGPESTKKSSTLSSQDDTSASAIGNKAFPRIQKLIEKQRTSQKKRRACPCLICGAPACVNHSSEVFRKEKVTVCSECAPLFTMDFIEALIFDGQNSICEREEHVDHMIDVYDRTLLLLRYSSQYVDDIAAALEENTERSNKVGLGSTSAGIVSGITGVAAAATILTPAGPPLLIASLFFAGSATAVSAGNEAVNYFSEPNQLANRIIALHAMIKSLLRVTNALRDALLKEYFNMEHYGNDDGKDTKRLVVAPVGKNASRGGRLLSRASTTVMRTARLARFAGGALSAAILVWEANEMKSIVQNIRDGHPCEKAEYLRMIKEEIGSFPDTEALDNECRVYLKTMAKQRTGKTGDSPCP